MTPPKVIATLFYAGYSIRYLARLFGETELGIQALLRMHLNRRQRDR